MSEKMGLLEMRKCKGYNKHCAGVFTVGAGCSKCMSWQMGELVLRWQGATKLVLAENIVFLYCTMEHSALNFVRAQRLGIGGLVQADGTYQTNWNGLPIIPMGTTDLAGQFHLICHVVVHTENLEVYRGCWSAMVRIAAHFLHKDHAEILGAGDAARTTDLPKLHTLSGAQRYTELYQAMQKESVALTKEEMKHRAEVQQMDELAAEAFKAAFERDQELQKKKHRVVPTTEEFADDFERFQNQPRKQIYEFLRGLPERSMSDGAGYIGKAAQEIFNHEDFQPLNCAAHISVRSLAPGGSLHQRFRQGGDERRGSVGKFRRDFRITQGRPNDWMKDLYCAVCGLCACFAMHVLDAFGVGHCGHLQLS